MDDLEEGEINDTESVPAEGQSRGPKKKALMSQRIDAFIPRDFWSDRPIANAFDYNHGFEIRGNDNNFNEQLNENTYSPERPRIGSRRGNMGNRHRPNDRPRNLPHHAMERGRGGKLSHYDERNRYRHVADENQYRPLFHDESRVRVPIRHAFMDTRFTPVPMRGSNRKMGPGPHLDIVPRYPVRQYKRDAHFAAVKEHNPRIRERRYLSNNNNPRELESNADEESRSKESQNDNSILPDSDKHEMILPNIKSIKEDLVKSSSSNEMDEYDLDDFQLLLERHKLIQQQLTAIGRQERDLKTKMSRNNFLDAYSDFKLIPNPNTIEVAEETDNNTQVISPEQRMVVSESLAVAISDFDDKVNPVVLSEGGISSPNTVGFLEQQIVADSSNMTGNVSDLVAEESRSVDIAAQSCSERIIVKKDNFKMSGDSENQRKVRRRGRRKKTKSKNPNILEVAKHPSGSSKRM